MEREQDSGRCGALTEVGERWGERGGERGAETEARLVADLQLHGSVRETHEPRVGLDRVLPELVPPNAPPDYIQVERLELHQRKERR